WAWVQTGRVWNVRLDQHVPHADVLDELRRSDLLEPEHYEDVIVEILGWTTFGEPKFVLCRHVLVELIVHRLKNEGHPSNPALGGHHPQLREPIEEIAIAEVHDDPNIGHIHLRGLNGEGPLSPKGAPRHSSSLGRGNGRRLLDPESLHCRR